MPISGWIMVGWFVLVMLAGAGLLYWGWRTGGLKEWEQGRYFRLEEQESQSTPAGRYGRGEMPR